MDKLVDRLRDGISGPHKRGAQHCVTFRITPDDLSEAADRIEVLEAKNARLRERLGPLGMEVVMVDGRLTPATRAARQPAPHPPR